jgi:lipid-binding SYLF domain-containing protein
MKLGLLCLVSATALLYAQTSNRNDSSDQKKEAPELQRIHASTAAFTEMMDAKDGGIAQDILDRAACIGIIPNLKRAAFFFGGQYGRGLVTCRLPGAKAAQWSAPSMIVLEGGSFGLQFGAGEADVIFAVMNRSGEQKLTHDKITLGADAAGMAGPVGREVQANTDVWMKAEILSWSRAHGVFAGVSIEGASLRPDNDANRALYGRDFTQGEILRGEARPPAAARTLITRLERYVPKQTGD